MLKHFGVEMNRTKEELSGEINKMLGTDIDFTKLSKDELEKLYEAVQRLQWPFPILDKPLGEILNRIDRRVLGKPLRELTLAELFGLPKEGKGLLGLRVLTRIMSRMEEKLGEPKS